MDADKRMSNVIDIEEPFCYNPKCKYRWIDCNDDPKFEDNHYHGDDRIGVIYRKEHTIVKKVRKGFRIYKEESSIFFCEICAGAIARLEEE